MIKNSLVSFGVGGLFALGLGISGMTQPQKVMGFLDLFGNWDPSLIFVMIGAIVVHFVFFKIIKRRSSPLLSREWHLPTKKEITPSLISGAFLFGVGWALAGYCPGPAITSLASFKSSPIVFSVSMIAGMLLFRWVDKIINFKK